MFYIVIFDNIFKENPEIEGVFSTSEKAQNFIKIQDAKNEKHKEEVLRLCEEANLINDDEIRKSAINYYNNNCKEGTYSIVELEKELDE